MSLVDPKDFTVSISATEKVLTSLFFALSMGILLFYSRRYALVEAPLQKLSIDLFFALGLFGIIRLVRGIFAQHRRGLILAEDHLQVITLLSKPHIPFEQLAGSSFIFTEKSAGQIEVSFLWGQQRFRLPCSRWESLSEALVLRGFRVLHNKEASGELQRSIEAEENKSARKYPLPAPSLATFAPVLLWAAGVLGILFLSTRGG